MFAWSLPFPTDEGGPKHYSIHVLRRALKRAKLHQVTVHSLRHTFASTLIMQGAPPTEVAHLLGHSSPAVTLKVYSHWFKTVKTTSVEDFAKSVYSAILSKRLGSKTVAEGPSDAAQQVIGA